MAFPTAGTGKPLPAVAFGQRPGYARRMGALYHGDNLGIVQRYLNDETVGFVHLDPPFNFARNYNAFFHEKNGTDAASQIRAFDATSSWNRESQKVNDKLILQPDKVGKVMQTFDTFLGTDDMMAYLGMMAQHLVVLRCVLKPASSLYLHCDPLDFCQL
jgi:adenine specific DNA methylase Mod